MNIKVSLVLVACFLTAMPSCGQKTQEPSPPIGESPPVTQNDLRGKEFRVSNPSGSFEWSFGENDFEISGSIPAEVQKEIIGPGKATRLIKGKWSLDNGKIRLTELTADGEPMVREPELSIYRTGSIRVGIGSSEYAFQWSPDR